MASEVADGPSAVAPGGVAADAPGLRPLLASRPGLVLPLALIAAALALTLFASVQLWRLESRPSAEPAGDLARLYAQAAVETLRLHEAAERQAADPAARGEFVRRYHLLLRRLVQLETVPRDPAAAGIDPDGAVTAARRRLQDRDPSIVDHGPRELADLAARLTQLERALTRAGDRAQDAYRALRADRAAGLRSILGLGAAAVLAGLLGLAWLVLFLVWALGRLHADRRLERDLRRARDSAAWARNIAAVIAHQMRTPLTVIDSAAQRMLARPDLADRPGDAAALLRIRRQVGQLLHFMDGAMLAGEAENGAPSFHPRPVRVQDLIAAILAHDGTLDRRQRLVLAPGPAGLRALCDPGLAFHALANLVENALKYSPDGSPVELHVAETGGMAVISVVDHGAGVPPADQEAIFGRFWRGANAAGRPGSGVGLWLARRLAEIQGGTIRVHSDGRSGARFDLLLPAAGRADGPSACPADPFAGLSPPPPPASGPGRGAP